VLPSIPFVQVRDDFLVPRFLSRSPGENEERVRGTIQSAAALVVAPSRVGIE
jgi:hypothetical protein